MKSIDHLRSEGDLNISPLRRSWQDQRDPETQKWLAEDSKYFLHQSLSTPCLDLLQSCAGATIQTGNGHTLLDFHGNNVHTVGFSHPEVIHAITEQMARLSFCTRRYTNIPAIQLAKRLSELAPGDLNRVLFAPGGTSAIGMALKLARAATGRYKTISMWDSFHGASLDAISIGGEAIFRQAAGPLLPGCEHVPPPYTRQCPFKCGAACNLNCADYIEYVLEKEGDIAAVIGETVRSIPFIPPLNYWKKVRAACDEHGALLILDEIPHCLGRTGRMFTVEHYDVVPDMLVIGKGLGGGIFPLAALIARESLNIVAEKALGHYTHEKSPVACAAALATINIIERDALPEHALELGQYALQRLSGMMKRFDFIGDVRGLGLLIGVEIVKNRNSMERAPDLAEKVMYDCLRHGLNFKLTLGNTITLTPALTITRGEMDQAFSILEASFEKLAGTQTPSA